jgi:hypothetical protein
MERQKAHRGKEEFQPAPRTAQHNVAQSGKRRNVAFDFHFSFLSLEAALTKKLYTCNISRGIAVSVLIFFFTNNNRERKYQRIHNFLQDSIMMRRILSLFLFSI